MKYIISILLLCFINTAAAAISFEDGASQELTLFYPGQAGWEFVLIPSTHKGAKGFRGGSTCRECHEGEEADMGALLVTGEKLEPTPIEGKRGSIPVTVSMNREADTLGAQLKWKARENASGTIMVSLMIGSPDIKEAVRAGCWGGCHSDTRDMPDDAGLTKYLPASRTKLGRTGGGENYRSEDEIAQLMSEDKYLELWQAKIESENVITGSDGYLIEQQHGYETSSVSAMATLNDGWWTVTLERPVTVADKRTYQDGVIYPVGFAIHEDGSTGRFHHVSLGYSFVMGEGEADFVIR